MKKRILSILLLCCMVLTLLPTTVLAADGPMDTIPKYDVSIDVYNRTSDISIKDSRSYYIYSSVPDKLRDTWAWDKKIFIKGDKTAPHVFIDGVNIKMSPSSLGPAIELNKKASAYIYFIGKNSSLQGADGRAAIQKNRSEGQLYVLARTGTTVTCKGGDKAAGIGGSYATRNIFNGYYNGDMYGHGVNMHFGSRSNPDYWGGTIAAIGGNGGAGIGGGQGGSGEKLYFYSGTVQANGGRLASGIGGSYKGRGSEIYIYGGTVSAQGGEGGAGIGGGCWTTEQDMNGINAAHDIYISGGTVTAKGGHNGAGIGGGYYYPPVTYYTLCFETGGGSDISSVQGTYNAYIDLTQYVPTWRGHTFTGWYSERSLKNKVSGVYLTKDMTVYAGWRVTTVPQTGDSSVLGLWGISLCTSLAGCLALTTWQIRRRREEKSLQSIEK